LRVAGEEGDAFAEGLGQQEPVEGILVQRGQAVDVDRVLAGDGKLGVAVVKQAAAQQTRLDLEVLSSECLLRRAPSTAPRRIWCLHGELS